MKTIKTMMKPLLALILLLAVVPCALPTYAEEALPPLSDLFLYEADAGEENAEASRAANAAQRGKRQADPAVFHQELCGVGLIEVNRQQFDFSRQHLIDDLQCAEF